MLSFNYNLRVDLFFETLIEIFILHGDREKGKKKKKPIGWILFFYLVTENKTFFFSSSELPPRLFRILEVKAMFRTGSVLDDCR